MTSLFAVASPVLLVVCLLPVVAAAEPAERPSGMHTPRITDLTWAAYDGNSLPPAPSSTGTASLVDGPEPRECKPRYMVGPGLGIPLGLGAMTMGSVFTAAGARGILTTTNESKLIAVGSVALVLGTAAFLYSSVKLSRNKTRRRQVCGRVTDVPDWRRQ
ncbi:MAG: hypothetical protein AAGF92_21115 [Myxococcota bacterium]